MLLLSSCTFNLFKTYEPVDGADFNSEAITYWFHDDPEPRLFRTTIDMTTYHYSGIMVFNPASAGGYRVVYITEFGLKIFDMEFFSGRESELHYCMPSLNRKSVANTLQDDIGLLLRHEFYDDSFKTLFDKKTGSTVIKVKDKGKRFYYLLDKESGRMVSVIQASLLFRKARADFYSENNDRLDSVKIEHYNKSLFIRLIQLNEDTSPVDE